MEHITVELQRSLQNLSLPNVTVNLIHVFQKHIKTFDECQIIIQKKYPNLGEEDFETLISELYEEAVVPHIATQSKGCELDYLKTLLDMLLHKYVSRETFSCLSGRFLLREILAIQCLEPLVQIITDPNFVNEIVIDILEPSIPLSIILKQWEDANREIENKEIEDEASKSLDVIECSSPETNYESTQENVIKTKAKAKTEKTKQRSRKLRGRPKAKKKIFEGESSADSDDSDVDRSNMFRFDKLDMKTSYPVYGSTSARDHEKNNKLDKLDSSKDLEPIDSGRASFGREPTPQNSDDELIGSSPTKEGWAFCPNPKAEIFRHPSFYGMPLKQDDIKEQFKAKVNSVPDLSVVLRQVSCMDPCVNGRGRSLSCSSMDINIDGHQAKNFTHSIDGSVTMEFGKKGNVPSSLSTALTITQKPVDSDIKEKDTVTKVHKSGEHGIFYEIAPSCPTCIEMTSLASPFQNERAQVVFSEKDLKEREKKEKERHKKVPIIIDSSSGYEHECGLQSEHFCNREADVESFTIDPVMIENPFKSCIEQPFDLSDHHSISSGTLLASGETCDESDRDGAVTEGTESSSFDNISDISFTNNSTTGLDLQDSTFDYEIVKTDRSQKPKRKLSHAGSVQTFKTAIESESPLDSNSRIKSSSSIDLKQKDGTTDKQFFQFFKKGNICN